MKFWTVESSLCLLLDVSMKEDDSKIYRGNVAKIQLGLRKAALNILRSKTIGNVGLPRKQKRANGSTDYLEKELTVGLVALGGICAFTLSSCL